MEYHDSLEFIFHGYIESDGELGESEGYSPDEELESEWEAFCDAARECIGGLSESLMEALDEHEAHWDADVYHTLVGAGVGVWDGRWDVHMPNGVTVGGIERALKSALSGYADFTGGGSLADSFRECASRQMGCAVVLARVETNEGTSEELSYDGDLCLRASVNEDSSQPVQAGLGWVNSASIQIDGDRDRVAFTLSTGDPRGCFVFEAVRADNGAIYLHLPYPGEGMAHEDTVQLRPGTLALKRTLPTGGE